MLSRRRFLLTAAATAPTLALHAEQKPAPQPCESSLPAPILALTDRRKDISPITVDERNERLERARDLMKQNGLDAILITTGASMQYFTGVRWGQSERLFAYVIPQAAAPFVICPHLERDRLNEAQRNFPEHDTTLSYLWQETQDPYAPLQHALADSSVSTGTLGIEEHTQFAFSNAIAKACPAL